MEVIGLLIFISLFVAIGFLIAFLWAVKSGQLDDDYTPALRILFDDNKSTFSKKESSVKIDENLKVRNLEKLQNEDSKN